MTIAICMPIGDKSSVHPKTFESLSKLRSPFPLRTYSLFGVRVDTARNWLTAEALAAPDVTHILWVDDDMVFAPGALEQLLAHDLPIVGGLCHNRRIPWNPTVLRLLPPELGFHGSPLYGYCYDFEEMAGAKGLVNADATGSAFILVRRDVYEAIGRAFPEDGPYTIFDDHAPGPTTVRVREGEDTSFCRRVRELGYQIKIDTTVDVGHMAEVVVDREFARHNRWDADPRQRLHWIEPFPQNEPVATVVIPTYNQRTRLLREAVLSAIRQTVPVEIVVVDDGTAGVTAVGEDGKEYVVAGAAGQLFDPIPGLPVIPNDAHLRVVRHDRNRGIASALNTGIADMTTPWFAWLASDDLMDPYKIARQLYFMRGGGMERRSGFLASFHSYRTIESEEAEAELLTAPERATRIAAPLWKTRREAEGRLGVACDVNGSTVMLHRSVFEVCGYFDERLKYAQDWEMWCRVSRSFFWLPIEDVLGTRREYGNLTSQIERSESEQEIRDLEDDLVLSKYGMPKDLLVEGGKRILGNERGKVGRLARGRYEWAGAMLSFNGVRTVLDVGCGTGYGLPILAERSLTATGFDPYGPAIEYGQRRGFAVKDRLVTEMPSGPFDAVLAFDVLQEFECSIVDAIRWLLVKAPLAIVSFPAGTLGDPHVLDALKPVVFTQDEEGVISPLTHYSRVPDHYLFIIRGS